MGIDRLEKAGANLSIHHISPPRHGKNPCLMPRDNKLKMAVDGVGLLSRAIVGLKSAEALVQPQAGGQKKNPWLTW